MKFAFVHSKTLAEAREDGDKLARVYDCCRECHPDAELCWLQTLHALNAFKPDKIFVSPDITPNNLLRDYPCEKDFTLEDWFKND